MKKVRIAFDYDGYLVSASGTVLDSLYVDNINFEVRDHDEESVMLDRKQYDEIQELCEELILEKYNDLELYLKDDVYD